jgi:hypothetical protein
MWNEFLPISIPITAIVLLSFWDMACSFVFGAPLPVWLAGRVEHGRTIPFSDIGEQQPTRFRTIQVCPKDLRVLPRQAKMR